MIASLLLALVLVQADGNSCDAIGGEDCCPLMWTEMTHFPGRIPSHAVVGGVYYGINKYFSTIDYDFGAGYTTKIGVKTEDNEEGVWFESGDYPYLYTPGCMKGYKKDCQSASPSSNIVILTNPFGCSLKWWMRQYKRQMPAETNIDLFLNMGGHYFARRMYNKNYNGSGAVDMLIGENLGDYHEVSNWGVWNYGSAGTEILCMDCQESVAKIIKAELIKLIFSISMWIS